MRVPPPEALRDKWDRRYAEAQEAGPAARVLVENRHLLPPGGDALDLACGLGANALLLAEWGFRVQAWDLSPVAIGRLDETAAARGLALDASVRDVLREPPAPGCLDVIVVSHFLDRSLAPRLTRALRPGGLIFYQTFVRDAVSLCGPGRPEYRLGTNELLQLFSDLRIRVYREEGRLGDTALGWRDQAMLVGEKTG